MQIIVYITDNKDIVLGGDPLTLFMPNDAARQEFLQPLAEMLDAEVMQMPNGDHLLLQRIKN